MNMIKSYEIILGMKNSVYGVENENFWRYD